MPKLSPINANARPLEHDFIPEQVKPFPLYPGRHAHAKLPTVLEQTAWEWHPPLFNAHSSISVQTHTISLNTHYKATREKMLTDNFLRENCRDDKN